MSNISVLKSRDGRIYWTDAEKDKLVELCAKIQAKNPTLTLGVCLKRAQEQLPPDRRRRIVAPSRLQWLVTGIKKFNVTKAAPQPEPTPPTLPPRPVELQLEDVPLDKLLLHLMGRVSAAFNQLDARFQNIEMNLRHIAGRLQGNGNSLTANQYNQSSAESIGKSKIIIVGLKQSQIAEINTAFPNNRFGFITSEKWNKISYPPDSTVILMVKFISHSYQYAATHMAKIRNIKVKWCNGGLTALKELIQQLINDQN